MTWACSPGDGYLAWSAGWTQRVFPREREAQGLGAIRASQREAYGWWRRLRWYQKTTIAMVNGMVLRWRIWPTVRLRTPPSAPMKRSSVSEINRGILPEVAQPR
ncbi:MAG: hypothetical protein U0Q16_35050 [Bryobacteraceae bacterium]